MVKRNQKFNSLFKKFEKPKEQIRFKFSVMVKMGDVWVNTEEVNYKNNIDFKQGSKIMKYLIKKHRGIVKK